VQRSRGREIGAHEHRSFRAARRAADHAQHYRRERFARAGKFVSAALIA